MASLALAFDILARDRGASKTFDKVGDSAERAGKKGFGFGSAVKAGIGIAAGAVAAAGLGALIKDSVGEAREAQKVGRTTEAIIKATGGASKISASQVGDLATAISNKAGVDDEAIQSGANLLLTFKKVRNEAGKGNDVFNRATQAATDLSSAGFGSIEGSSKMLGKALNDPVKGITALGRAGVTFTKGQKDQIKALVASGKTLQAQKLILKEVETQVGGVAAANASMGDKTKVAIGNLKEQFGTALLPVIEKVQTFLVDKAVPAVSSFISNFQSGTGTAGKFRDVLQGIADKVGTFISQFKAGEGAGGRFRDILQRIVDVAQGVSKWIGENATTVQILAGALGAGLVAFEAITLAVKAYTAVQAALNVVMSANPIGLVVVALAALVGGLIVAYKQSETFRNIVNNAWDTVKLGALELARVAVNALSGLVNMFLTTVSVLVTGAAKAFGWVPGLGPKLKAAAANVEGFKNSANAALAKVERDLKIKADTTRAQNALNDLRRNASRSVTVPVFLSTRYTAGSVNVAGLGRQNAGNRAAGGPVSKNSLYAVGENRDGSWNKTTELFRPTSPGRVINQAEMRRAMGLDTAPVSAAPSIDYDRLAAAMSGQPIVVQAVMQIDGRAAGEWHAAGERARKR